MPLSSSKPSGGSVSHLAVIWPASPRLAWSPRLLNHKAVGTLPPQSLCMYSYVCLGRSHPRRPSPLSVLREDFQVALFKLQTWPSTFTPSLPCSVFLSIYLHSFPWPHNKIPQTRWLETTEIHSLTILEAKSQKSRCPQGHAFLGGSGGETYSSEVYVPVLSRIWLFATPKDCSPPGSFVHGIFQTRMLDRLPFPTPGDLPNTGIKALSLASPALAGKFFTTVPPRCCGQF